MSEELFERRRRSERWRRIRRILFWLLVVAAVAALIWLIWFSRVLNVRRVEVEGMRTLTAAEIRTHADVPIGGPLARVPIGAIETRVARMPRVDSVETRRKWPHVLLIRIRERVPIAWVQIDGQIRLVDKYGVDFRTVRTGPPSLTELRIDSRDPDVRVKAFESSAAVIDFLRSDAPDIFNTLDHVSADTQDSIHLELSGNRTVVWGSAERNEKKLTVLRALLRGVKAERYDVSAPELPTTKSTAVPEGE